MKFARYSLFLVTLLAGLYSAQAIVIVNDTWGDGLRTNLPFASDNSVWYSNDGAGASLSGLAATPSPNQMVGFPAAGSSRVWLSYYTTNSAGDSGAGNTNAVDLAVGQTIKLTLTFIPTNVAAVFNGSYLGMRIGLFDFADGGYRTNRDNTFIGTSTGSGTNVLGYFTGIAFLQTWTNNPIEFRVRTNAVDANAGNLMGTTATYVGLGSGPANYATVDNPKSGFQSETNYTLTFSIRRYATSNVLTTTIVGGTMNVSHTAIDTTYYTNHYRFDAVALRANRKEDTADQIAFQHFTVEVIDGPPTVSPFSITSIARLSPSDVKLTWDSVSGSTYQVLSRDTLGTGSWVTNATVTASSASTSFTNSGISAIPQRFYRVVSP
jgi:hypothetical protein